MNYYRIIKSLITEIRLLRKEKYALQYEADKCQEEEEYNYSQLARLEKRNQSLREENDRRERQREYERQEEQSRQWQREDLVKKLDRATSWGDEWGADRVKRDLKNLL